jgi:hypothetical protein
MDYTQPTDPSIPTFYDSILLDHAAHLQVPSVPWKKVIWAAFRPMLKIFAFMLIGAYMSRKNLITVYGSKALLHVRNKMD